MAIFDGIGKKITVTSQTMVQKAKGMADITGLKAQISDEQKKIDKYSESHSKKTVKELVLKIRGSLKYAYARGLITNDFGHLLKSKGKELPKRNIPLSVTEFKKLRQYCLNHAEEDEFNVLVALAL